MAYTATDFLNADAQLNERVARNKLLAYVNVHENYDIDDKGYDTNPEWEVIGFGVSDSSIAISIEKETTNDILGNSNTRVSSLSMEQEFADYSIRKGSRTHFLLEKYLQYKQKEKFETFEVLLVRAYIEEGTGENVSYHAELHKGCTITPTNLGGSDYVNMPITIDYSQDKVLGTVNKLAADDEFAFTIDEAETAKLGK